MRKIGKPTKLELYNVETLLQSPNVSHFEFKKGNTTVFSGTQFVNYIKSRYRNFYFVSKWDDDHDEDYNILASSVDFANVFENWRNSILDNVVRFWDALAEEYDPLENYDRREEGSYTDAMHKGSRTATNTDTKDAVNSNSNVNTTTTPTGTTTTTDYVNGENNVAELPTGKSVTSFDNTNTVVDSVSKADEQTNYTRRTGDKVNNYTETTDISDTIFDKNVRTFDGYRVHGNIGVTTASQLLQGEKEIRLNNYVYSLIDEFVKLYLVYID